MNVCGKLREIEFLGKKNEKKNFGFTKYDANNIHHFVGLTVHTRFFCSLSKFKTPGKFHKFLSILHYIFTWTSTFTDSIFEYFIFDCCLNPFIFSQWKFHKNRALCVRFLRKKSKFKFELRFENQFIISMCRFRRINKTHKK